MYYNKPLDTFVTKSKIKQTAAIIILHGSGDNGNGFRSWLSSLIDGNGFFLPYIKYIFPSAPIQPYTPFCGRQMAVWFDRITIGPYSPECTESVDEACTALHEIVNKEILSGTQANRIIVGGFSMGGALTLHYVYRYLPNHHQNIKLSAAFALSAFLNNDSAVYKSIDKISVTYPPLFQAHGDLDTIVSCDWGLKTAQQLKKCNIDVEFKLYKNFNHEMVEREVMCLRDWISQKLPESCQD